MSHFGEATLGIFTVSKFQIAIVIFVSVAKVSEEPAVTHLDCGKQRQQVSPRRW